jgi:hypothetical protein
METTGFAPVLVTLHLDTRDGCGAVPQRSLFPIVGNVLRLEKKHMGRQPAVQVGHQEGQLAYTRPCAGAVWVGEHDERGAARRALNVALGRPLHRRAT